MTLHYGLAYVTLVVKEALQSLALTLLVHRGTVRSSLYRWKVKRTDRCPKYPSSYE